MKLLLSLALIVVTNLGFAQMKVITGRVLDKNSQLPVPFPTIKLDDGSVWAVGNSEGKFNLELPESSKSIFFSSVGYQPHIIEVDELTQSDQICVYMKEDIMTLPEIVISPARIVDETLGFEEAPKYSKALTYGEVKYSAFANPFRIKNRPAKINEASIFIKKNDVGDFTLRCRVMDRDSNGNPGEDLLKENIIVSTDITNGWINFDLSEYELWVEDRMIFLVVEVLQDGKAEEINKQEFTISTPSFSYLHDTNSAYISTTPGVWRQNDNRVISNLKISYMED